MTDNVQTLPMMLRTLKLPAFVEQHEPLAAEAERQGWGYTQYLRELVEQEAAGRRQRRIDRHQRHSGLPGEKTLATLDQTKLPTKVRRLLPHLCDGGFVSRAQNILAFGLPGRGKTHLVAAVGHELIQRGFRVYFTPAYQLVQRLLAAKRDLQLERVLRRLDGFDAVIVDDIGYIQQDREEMEVLFTFLAERYERRSIIITSNLVFSQWDKIFKDPMTTAAAIDRLVHHATIIELTGKSYRTEAAESRKKGDTKQHQAQRQEEATQQAKLSTTDGEE
jgi:DNA replication protein DnaC